MKILKEFTDFINRGNVIDLAVGVIIGAAFGKIVSSLVADIITPLLGIIVGGVNLSKLAVVIGEQQGKEVVLSYGKFLQSGFDFLVTAAALFFIIRLVNHFERLRKIQLKKDQEAAEAAPVSIPEEIMLLREIRDSLKQGRTQQ
jgi:large conductance mechanosensitive channel